MPKLVLQNKRRENDYMGFLKLKKLLGLESASFTMVSLKVLDSKHWLQMQN